MKAFGAGVAPHDLQALFEDGSVGSLPDGPLLDRFIARRDELAFEALVRRHGPLVWGVCRRILRDHHDAEDAFQATFLVLARKAATIRPREMLPNWLYGVARQTAAKARLMAARRRARERLGTEWPEPETTTRPIVDDRLEALEQELGRLPASYRAPIILCHLEGKGHQEAAEELGWPVGTLSGRLSRARGMLAKRLSRRGLALSAGSLVLLSSRPAASACMPTSLVKTTIKLSGASGAGPAATGLVSAEVAALARGVMKTMLWKKIRIGSLLMLNGAAIGIGLIARSAEAPARMQAAGPPATQKRPAEPERRPGGRDTTPDPFDAIEMIPAEPERKPGGEGSRKLLQELDWALTRVDPDKGRISALARWTWNTVANDEFATSGIRTGLHLSFSDLPVAKDAEILIDGRPGTLADLRVDKETFKERYGLQMTLRLSADGSAITRIDARSQNAYFFLKGVDVTRRIITVGIGASGLLAGQDDLLVARDAKILIEAGKARAREGGLADLRAGMRISFELATEDGRIVVRGIRAEE
jgi:RNA polymerase sigma factor (sigma-70 family)